MTSVSAHGIAASGMECSAVQEHSLARFVLSLHKVHALLQSHRCHCPQTVATYLQSIKGTVTYTEYGADYFITRLQERLIKRKETQDA